MKRGRVEVDYRSDMAANCLMLLSKIGGTGAEAEAKTITREYSGGRVFVCKTCNREFPSFQALGGHRASHKKPKLSLSASADEDVSQNSSPAKPKTHECSICGLEFAIGQALGGHMRRHRQAAADAESGVVRRPQAAAPVPVLKKSSSSKRVCVDLDLDLHLAPPGNYYDLKLQLMAPPRPPLNIC